MFKIFGSEATPEMVLTSFEHFLGVHITIHDLKGFLADEQGVPLLPGRNIHSSPYCLYGRWSHPSYNRRCNEHCHTSLHNKLQQPFTLQDKRGTDEPQNPFLIHSCWKGVTEVAVPVIDSETMVAVLFAGPFNSGSPTAVTSENRELFTLWQTLPAPETEKIESIKNALLALRAYIISIGHKLRHEPRQQTRQEVIRGFFRRYGHKKLRLSDLAAELNLSPSRTVHLLQEEFGKGFRELLGEEKIRRAKSLLISTPMSLSQIAEELSLPSSQYLNRIFKTYTHLTPGKWRAHNSHSN